MNGFEIKKLFLASVALVSLVFATLVFAGVVTPTPTPRAGIHVIPLAPIGIVDTIPTPEITFRCTTDDGEDIPDCACDGWIDKQGSQGKSEWLGEDILMFGAPQGTPSPEPTPPPEYPKYIDAFAYVSGFYYYSLAGEETGNYEVNITCNWNAMSGFAEWAYELSETTYEGDYTPHLLFVEGKVVDSDTGEGINDATLTFRVFTDSSSNYMIYDENIIHATNANGNFNVTLGATRPLPLALNKHYWIAMWVGDEQIQLSPTSPYRTEFMAYGGPGKSDTIRGPITVTEGMTVSGPVNVYSAVYSTGLSVRLPAGSMEAAVSGSSEDGVGVMGVTGSGSGILGRASSPAGTAGSFYGNVEATGAITGFSGDFGGDLIVGGKINNVDLGDGMIPGFNSNSPATPTLVTNLRIVTGLARIPKNRGEQGDRVTVTLPSDAFKDTNYKILLTPINDSSPTDIVYAKSLTYQTFEMGYIGGSSCGLTDGCYYHYMAVGKATATPTCYDSDGGQTFTTWGFVQTTDENGYGSSAPDQCKTQGTLTEYYCSGTTRMSIDKLCRDVGANYICQDGECMVASA